MKYVCMDTSHRHLVISLIEDNKTVAGCSFFSWKKQSETIFPKWMELMNNLGWNADDLNGFVITEGPGSYTGVRIAMTIAKVFCTTRNIPLFTVSTLQLYAGVMDNAYVLLDARSNRAYVAKLNKGVFVTEPSIKLVDDIKNDLKLNNCNVLGDIELIGMDNKDIDFVNNFLELKPFWKQVENIHTLVPCYLKDQNSYRVK